MRWVPKLGIRKLAAAGFGDFTRGRTGSLAIRAETDVKYRANSWEVVDDVFILTLVARALGAEAMESEAGNTTADTAGMGVRTGVTGTHPTLYIPNTFRGNSVETRHTTIEVSWSGWQVLGVDLV